MYYSKEAIVLDLKLMQKEPERVAKALKEQKFIY